MPTQVTVWLRNSGDELKRTLTVDAVNKQSVPVALVLENTDQLPKSDSNWVWILDAGMAPKPDALEVLLSGAKDSQNIGQVGALHLDEKNLRRVTKLGLKFSRFGLPLNLASGQYDQSQFENLNDEFAVGFAGSIVRSDLLEELLTTSLPVENLTEDFEVSIRVRRKGFRVVSVAGAKIVGPQDPKANVRKTAIHLRMAHSPLFIALGYWLLLPILTIMRLGIRLAQKQPALLWQELVTGFWAFFSLPKRISSRRGNYKHSLREFRELRASWSETRRIKNAEFDAEESEIKLSQFKLGLHEDDSQRTKNFFESGGVWFALMLLLLNWQHLPVSEAITSDSLIQVSDDWFEIFLRTGASWQPLGEGFFGPSDPFNWVLLALTSLTFWAPNLSIVLLFWVAPALAFISARKAFTLLTGKAWQSNTLALVYSLLPPLTGSLQEGELATVIVAVTSPLLVYSVAKAAGLGRRGSARSDAKTWVWVGLSGLLLAVVASCSPAIAALALVALGVVAFTKLKRFGYLFWIPLPTAAIFLPTVWYLIAKQSLPLALLANPSLATSAKPFELQSNFEIQNPFTWSLAALLLMAILALTVKRWVISLSIALFGLLIFVLFIFTAGLSYPSTALAGLSGIGRSFNSGRDLAILLGFTLLVLVVHFLSGLRKKSSNLVFALPVVAVIISLATMSALAVNKVNHTSTSVAPLLLQKQAKLDADLKLLVLNENLEQLNVLWLPVSGLHLEDVNNAYRFSRPKIQSEFVDALAKLAVSGGDAEISPIVKAHIGFILVANAPSQANLVAALESSPRLENAGTTPYGLLWRVKEVTASNSGNQSLSPWSLTKSIQLTALLSFALLAIPTRARRSVATESVIFVDQSDGDQNA